MSEEAETSRADVFWREVHSAIRALTEPSATDSRSVLTRRALDALDNPRWPVRVKALRVLAEECLPNTVAADAIARATHDPVDWVALTALEIAGEFRIEAAIPDIIKIVGWPSNFTRPSTLRKPVGMGAAYAKRALLRLLGSDDPNELRRIEDEWFLTTSALTKPGDRCGELDVVEVPAGPFEAGGEPVSEEPFRMDTLDHPPTTAQTSAFLIDRFTVTNERYAAFLDATQGDSSYDHPDQPKRSRSEPSHWYDERFSAADFPVVGIDWYDAWAFASWSGGFLPSELEWEKAARGTEGRRYPWGESFDPDRCHFVETAFLSSVTRLDELEELLLTASPNGPPAHPVVPVTSHANGASPYGAVQMAGNVWEMTRTNYFTRIDMDPFVRGREATEFINRREAYFVLKGGAWSSPPVCLTTPYRGRDLISDRHCEVGFRCAYNADQR